MKFIATRQYRMEFDRIFKVRHQFLVVCPSCGLERDPMHFWNGMKTMTVCITCFLWGGVPGKGLTTWRYTEPHNLPR